MADTTVTVAFNADTSGLTAATQQVKSMMTQMTDSTADTRSSISDVFTTLQTMSDAVVKGIVTGTQTWQQAVTRTGSNMLATFLNQQISRVTSWIESEAQMTAATVAGNATRTASDDAAGTASIAGKAAQALASIATDAKEVFGGVFAFLSPSMGPAAAAPAAAASAEVLSQAGGIASYAVGSWNIPGDGLAYLHQGEMVVPRTFASDLRDNGGLGGGNQTFAITINAIDTQTGTQFLRNNASTIAQTLAGQMRNFNSALKSN